MFQILPPLVSTNSKTFVIDSSDRCIAKVLKEHGWKETHKESTIFDLKWTWKSSNKQIDALQTEQRINHFKDSEQITTKLGLSLLFKRNPNILSSGKSYLHFYPRSYNLSTEKQQFLADFTRTGILNLLKKIIVCLQIYSPEVYDEANKIYRSNLRRNSGQILQQLFNSSRIVRKIDKDKFTLALNGQLLVRLLFYLQNIFSLTEVFQFSNKELFELLQYSQQDFHLQSIRQSQVLQQSTDSNLIVPSLETISLLILYHKKCLKQINGYFQDGFTNIWVVKSNHSSRGRNISLISAIEDAHSLDNGMKLVQKYIENIWVLHDYPIQQIQTTNIHNQSNPLKQKYEGMSKLVGKKFDIRFWVLVKSFSPFIAYIYDEAYLRISSDPYQLDCLQQKTAHLTNFSVNWKSISSKQSHQSSFLLYSYFLNYLNQCEQVQTTKITTKIHQIILETLKLVEVKEDPRCFELFGFDIILDAKLNPWILQCNMSPACSPRGELKSILNNMTKGMLSLLGFIQQQTYGWKILHDDSRKLSFLRQINLNNSMKTNKSKRDLTRGSILRSSIMNWNDMLLSAKKIQWKKYAVVENIHFYHEKAEIIQKFCKSRYGANRRQQVAEQRKPKFKIGVSLSIIKILVALSKKRKKYWLRVLKSGIAK